MSYPGTTVSGVNTFSGATTVSFKISMPFNRFQPTAQIPFAGGNVALIKNITFTERSIKLSSTSEDATVYPAPQ